jgi:hypothetical protein
MTDHPANPTHPDRRGFHPRRAGDPVQGDPGRDQPTTLPVPVAAAAQSDNVRPSAAERVQAMAAFAAQMMGQGGAKRGLRGGPQVLGQARATYLGAEWSGSADRRPPKGVITKTEI